MCVLDHHVYILLYRPISSRQLSTVLGSITSNKTFIVWHLKYFFLMSEKSMHFKRICLTVKYLLQPSQKGFSTLVNKWLCVIKVWPNFRRVQMTLSHLLRPRVFLGPSFDFIFESLFRGLFSFSFSQVFAWTQFWFYF